MVQKPGSVDRVQLKYWGEAVNGKETQVRDGVHIKHCGEAVNGKEARSETGFETQSGN